VRSGDESPSTSLKPDDRLARFVKYSKHIAWSENRVKDGAFLPHPNREKGNRLETSVFRIHQLSEDEIRDLAIPILNHAPSLTIYGRAEIPVQAVFEAGLALDVDDDPPRHASIIDWPSGDNKKAHRKMLAKRLADQAKFKPHTEA
jgi:hypothetical protein